MRRVGRFGRRLGRVRDDRLGELSDLSGLSDAQKQQREQMANSLNYVEESPGPDKNCANCSLYQEERYGSGCGGCQLFPGPVAEQGYCDSWAPKS